MDNFETHPRGTSEELRLSRELANEMKIIQDQFGKNIFYITVKNKLNALLKHYEKQLEAEKYQNGI